jgi:Fur family peroxide stress response transcriptional regulator
MNLDIIRNEIAGKGLKITPQRMAVMEALVQSNNHPTADKIIDFIHKHHPNIATGTVYKTLETFVEKGIIHKVNTDRDIMRYDPITDHHHHLYCAESDRIADYFDEDLNAYLKKYFEIKKIPGFEIENIKLQIKGKFNKTN